MANYDIPSIRRFCNKIVNDPDWFDFMLDLRTKYYKDPMNWKYYTKLMKDRVKTVDIGENTPKYVFCCGTRRPFGFEIRFGRLMIVKFFLKHSGKDTTFYFNELI